MPWVKAFIAGFVVGAFGASSLPGSGLVAAITSTIGGVACGLLFVGFQFTLKLLSDYHEDQTKKFLDKTEHEGLTAAAQGQPAESNPYLGENSDHFRGMAQAWFNGYVKKRD